MSRTERSPFMRFVRFVFLVAVLVGIVYGGAWWFLHPVALADLAADPSAFVGQEIRVSPSRVDAAAEVLGYPAVTLSDEQGTAITCVSEHGTAPEVWIESAKVRVHVVEVFGQEHLVLARVSGPGLLDQAMGIIAGEAPAPPDEPAAQTVRPTRGRVNRHLEFLGHPAFEVITEASGAAFVVTQEPPPALNARVSVEGAPQVALRFNGTALSFIPADAVVLSVGSLFDAPGEYLGRTVHLEGTVGRGLSLAGKTAYEFRGDDGREIVVWTDRGLPQEGEHAVLSGRVSVHEVAGRIIATTLVEEELATDVPGPRRPSESGPQSANGEGESGLSDIEWSIGDEGSESCGK